jgi:hypothetical protein
MLNPPTGQPSTIIVPVPQGLTPLRPGEQQAAQETVQPSTFMPPPPLKGLPPNPDQRPLTPETLQPAVPPAGTSAYRGRPPAQQPQLVAPASFQQPVMR